MLTLLQGDFEAKEEEIQKKMDELRDSKTKLEQNEKIKRDMMVSCYGDKALP